MTHVTATSAAMPPADDRPSYSDVVDAATRIAPFVHRTAVLRCTAIDEVVGARVHLKAEHLQRMGAFKMRGATNAVQRLDDTTARLGVAAHSSGNHAAALARAARTRGIPCFIVMPDDTPEIKVAATRDQGAEITFCAPTLADRSATLAVVLARTGATEIHPYDHPHVIAGQGTAALELLDDVPALTTLIAPVSGGGLLSGCAIAASAHHPHVRVWGVEPVTVADAYRSLQTGALSVEGNTTSIADGLLAVLSARTFAILSDHDVEIVTVTDTDIIEAMALLLTRAKQVVEPSGAAALAGAIALAGNGTDLGADVGVILSGGNVDLGRLASHLRSM